MTTATGKRPRLWVVHEGDNVATVIGGDIDAASQVELAGAASGHLQVLQPVPFGHKVALVDLPQGTNARKYSATIARVAHAARQGEHLHVHNLESLRGRGDQVVRKP